MPTIVTSIHDPHVLAVTCQRLNLPVPEEGCIQLEAHEVAGWIVHLPGVRYPIVIDTLTGLISYHPSDNVFGCYARIMRFIHRFYDIRHRLHRDGNSPVSPRPSVRSFRCLALAG